jgi:hypothetical protein
MASFFLQKNRWQPVAYRGRDFGAHGNEAFQAVSIAGEIIRLKSGRRTKHLITVDVNPVTMTRHGLLFVRRHDCSAPGR